MADRRIWLYYAVLVDIPDHVKGEMDLEAWIDREVENDTLEGPQGTQHFVEWEYNDGGNPWDYEEPE